MRNSLTTIEHAELTGYLFARPVSADESRYRARFFAALCEIELRRAMTSEETRRSDYTDVLTKIGWVIEDLDNWGADLRVA